MAVGKSGLGDARADEGITTARYDDLSEFDTTKFDLMIVVFLFFFSDEFSFLALERAVPNRGGPFFEKNKSRARRHQTNRPSSFNTDGLSACRCACLPFLCSFYSQ